MKSRPHFCTSRIVIWLLSWYLHHVLLKSDVSAHGDLSSLPSYSLWNKWFLFILGDKRLQDKYKLIQSTVLSQKTPHISFTVDYRKHQIFQLRKCTNLRKILAQFKFNVNPTSQKSQDRRTKHWKGRWY